jgi:hypothetical protein
MAVLMRAPRECGSWFWNLDGVAPDIIDGRGPNLTDAVFG